MGGILFKIRNDNLHDTLSKISVTYHSRLNELFMSDLTETL